MPRSRGAVLGVLLILAGAVAALAPLLGPEIDLVIGSDETWDLTEDRLFLSVIPGAAAVLGGLLVLLAANRPVASFGALLALAGGIWLVVGPVTSRLWEERGGLLGAGGRPDGSREQQTLEVLVYFHGIGALITALAGIALGRLTVRAVREAARPAKSTGAAPAAAAATAGAGSAPPSPGPRETTQEPVVDEHGRVVDEPAGAATPTGAGPRTEELRTEPPHRDAPPADGPPADAPRTEALPADAPPADTRPDDSPRTEALDAPATSPAPPATGPASPERPDGPTQPVASEPLRPEPDGAPPIPPETTRSERVEVPPGRPHGQDERPRRGSIPLPPREPRRRRGAQDAEAQPAATEPSEATASHGVAPSEPQAPDRTTSPDTPAAAPAPPASTSPSPAKRRSGGLVGKMRDRLGGG